MPFDRAFGIVCVTCEASSESTLCQQAVAASLRNRVKAGRWEPTIAGVVLQANQYSWTLNDPGDRANRERVANLSDTAPEILIAAAAYDAVMADENLDPSEGATHYIDDSIQLPAWATKAVQTVKIGRIIFFKAVP